MRSLEATVEASTSRLLVVKSASLTGGLIGNIVRAVNGCRPLLARLSEHSLRPLDPGEHVLCVLNASPRQEDMA
jgi:hypothetical protein